MNNMYCNYKYRKYRAKVHDKRILILSKTRQDGFDNYIDILGKEHDDLFMKEVGFDEVEVVYKEIVEIEFEGIYFQLFSSRITQSNIENGIFTCMMFIEAKTPTSLSFNIVVQYNSDTVDN